MLEGFTPEERAAFADYLVRAHANLRAYGRQLAGEEPRPATERLDPMPAGEESRPASALSQPSAPEEASHA